MIKNYRKKPIVIEAEQFFMNQPLPFRDRSAVAFDGENFYLETMHKNQKVILEDGDWVIPEPNGVNFYPCKPDVFEQTYELI